MIVYEYGDPTLFALAKRMTLDPDAEEVTWLTWAMPDSSPALDYIDCAAGIYAARAVFDLEPIGPWVVTVATNPPQPGVQLEPRLFPAGVHDIDEQSVDYGGTHTAGGVLTVPGGWPVRIGLKAGGTGTLPLTGAQLYLTRLA